MGEGNKKLSKRDGAASISDFQSAGYTREGLINYLALLGWSDPEHREILSLDMLIQAFDTTRLHAAAPQFDAQKLRWINHQQLQFYTPETLKRACEPFLQSLELVPPRSDTWLEQTLHLFQQDLHTLADCTPIFAKLSDAHARLTPSATEILQWPHVHALLRDWLEFLFQTLSDADTKIISYADIDPVLAQYCTQSTCTQAIQQLYQQLNDPSRTPDKLYALVDRIYKASTASVHARLQSHLCTESFSAAAKALQKTHQVKGKQLFMPLRAAIIGHNEGLDLKLACKLIPLGSLIKRALYAQRHTTETPIQD
jgi:glutamyl/glutaminyl-tRNA synthetase